MNNLVLSVKRNTVNNRDWMASDDYRGHTSERIEIYCEVVTNLGDLRDILICRPPVSEGVQYNIDGLVSYYQQSGHRFLNIIVLDLYDYPECINDYSSSGFPDTQT